MKKINFNLLANVAVFVAILAAIVFIPISLLLKDKN